MALVASYIPMDHWLKENKYHEAYSAKQGRAHVFWHNLLMGLCAHPELAEKYDIGFVDETVGRAVEKFVKDRGDRDNWQLLFSEANYSRGNWIHFNWIDYEPIARELYLHIAAENKWAMVELYFFWKPKLFVDTVAWTLGFGDIEQDDPLQPGKLCSKQERVENGVFLNPLSLTFLVCSLLLLMVAATDGKLQKKLTLHGRADALVLLLIFGGASLPCIAVVPNLMYAMPLIVVTLWLSYLLAFRLLAKGIRFWFSQVARRQIT